MLFHEETSAIVADHVVVVVRMEKLISLCAGGNVSGKPCRPVLVSRHRRRDIAKNLQRLKPLVEERLTLPLSRRAERNGDQTRPSPYTRGLSKSPALLIVLLVEPLELARPFFHGPKQFIGQGRRMLVDELEESTQLSVHTVRNHFRF